MALHAKGAIRSIYDMADPTVAWHDARVTNGPTEATNNLLNRIKRIGFGLRCLRHYLIRVLLVAGRPTGTTLHHHAR